MSDSRPKNSDTQSKTLDRDEDGNESIRNYFESERAVLRVRAQKALSDVAALLDQDGNSRKEKREIETAVEHLERILECMADEPLPSISSDALEFDEWAEYDELRYRHSVSGNMPMLLAAFVVLVENGIAPGRWIVDPLAEAFARILEDSDPEMVAARLGLQAKGSGARSPFQKFTLELERAQVNIDMRTLIEKYHVSPMNAANAMIDKFELDLAPKTLVNAYEARAKFPDLVRKTLDKYSEGLDATVIWLTEEAEQDFLNSFPPSAQKYLKK